MFLKDSQDQPPVGYCRYCHEEIYPTDPVYTDEYGMIHEECMQEFLLEDAGIEIIAEQMGYRKEVAKRAG